MSMNAAASAVQVPKRMKSSGESAFFANFRIVIVGPDSASGAMIALTRLYLHDVNIVAATALEALDPEGGRNRGIEAGANVIMPVLTPLRYRRNYDLYPGKTSVPATNYQRPSTN